MQMGSMGAELFEMSGTVCCASFLLSGMGTLCEGIVVAAFECGIEYQNGRGSIRDTA